MKTGTFSSQFKITGVSLAGLVLGALTAAAAEPTREQLAFFESKIRPILANHCYKCHSMDADRVKGGLYLDTREGTLKGGNTGPAVVPGDPDKSLLIRAVRYLDKDMEMPPKGEKLSDAQIADLVAWVKMGAPDPRVPKVAGGTYKGNSDKSRAHWAFQPLKRPAVPEVKKKDWVVNPVDNFILAKLEEHDMEPSPAADKRTLIRRATFDLIGLPPTPEEVQAFLADESPKAYEKLIERLLASKHYGERWGRYWLDVARYSDTKGAINGNRDTRIYPHAWTYRDYVIKAFNDDKPYDRFIVEQLAADKIATGGDRSPLAALGFLTVGNRFENNINEIINDRIDTVTKATLGLTVACARCHDHFFDPIPTKDYYSLHGIFLSSMEPKEEPLLSEPKKSPEYDDYLKQRAATTAEAQAAMDKMVNDLASQFRQKAYHYLYLAHYGNKLSTSNRTAYIRNNQLNNNDIIQILNRGALRGTTPDGKYHPVFGPWRDFASLADKDFPAKGKELAKRISENKDPKKPVHPYVAYSFRGLAPKSMQDIAAVYGALFAKVEQQWQALVTGYEKARKANKNYRGPAPTILADPNWDALRPMPLARINIQEIDPESPLFRMLPNALQGRVNAQRARLQELDMRHPGAPPRAMVLVDKPQPVDSPVFIRGEPGNRGEVVPRRFLEIVGGPNRPAFKNGSGRLELAQAIVSKSNPLTPRVMANRIWLHHFGEGIVTTPDDIGVQSAPPSHPELLDWLAGYFMDNGWSIKKMHRLIMLSNTYRQSSENNPRYAQIDPSNKLLWRANIRKLEFEALRDSILHLGGKLDLTVGGKPVDLTKEPYPTRRTIYGYIDRSALPEVFTSFDFANPDITTGKRYETIVPQQSLFLMNSPLVVEQAVNLVQRADFRAQKTDEDRVKVLYDLIYQRLPRPEEIKLGVEFIQQTPRNEVTLVQPIATAPAGKNTPAPKQVSIRDRKSLTAWEKYAHTLLLANEASFVN
jgi:mono/diheme cytochrome c family protein